MVCKCNGWEEGARISERGRGPCPCDVYSKNTITKANLVLKSANEKSS